jgi:hypothetical protein
MARGGSIGGFDGGGFRPGRPVPPGFDGVDVRFPPGGGGGDGGGGGGFPGLPVIPRGGGGGAYPASGMQGGGMNRRGFAGQNDPTLPDNLLGRYAQTDRINVWSHPGSAVDGGWKAISVDRPTILRPLQQLLGRVFYAPHVSLNALGSITPQLQAIRASGPGIVYLWAPGIWYVNYDFPGSANFAQFGAEDPGIVAAALAEPGFQAFTFARITTNLTPNTAEQLTGQNLFRRSVTITVGTPGSPKVAVGFNTTIDALPGSEDGIILSGQGASLTLEGQNLWRGPIFVAASIASVNITLLETS